MLASTRVAWLSAGVHPTVAPALTASVLGHARGASDGGLGRVAILLEDKGGAVGARQALLVAPQHEGRHVGRLDLVAFPGIRLGSAPRRQAD